MTAAADTFARFVDVLAGTLDDHDVTGEALASRVHLTRYHFDRVVAATAGEPPAAFRRRILLERAAYRLLDGARNVLDVALEAGYSSHEAFTRAFTRAYGRSPSDWRRQPSPIQLPAPSCVHFHPPGSLRLPAHRKETGMELVTRMVEHHVWLLGEMLERAARLPESALDAPIETSVDPLDERATLRSQLSRLVGQLAMRNAALDGRPYDFAVEDGESCARRSAASARRARRLLRTSRGSSPKGGSTTRSWTRSATRRRSFRTAGWWLMS